MSAKPFSIILGSVITIISVLCNANGSAATVVSFSEQGECVNNSSERFGKIVGKVFDADSLKSFPKGHIYIMKSPKWVEPANKSFYFDSSNVAIVDQNAEFEFSALPIGYYSLKTHIIGCPQIIDSVYISHAGQTIRLNLSIVLFHREPPLIVQLDKNALTTTTIRGKITSSSDGRPLENVKITLLETGQYGLTDGNGKYEIQKVKDGDYTVIMEKMGYCTVKHLRVSLYLEKKEQELSGRSITISPKGINQL